MKMMKWVMMGSMAVILLANTGCFVTMYTVKDFNNKQDERALEYLLQARANEDGAEGSMAVDARELPEFAKGYASAWKRAPGKMATAHGLDALWMSLVGWLAKEADNGGSSNGGISISSGGDVTGDITQINGDGNTVRQNTSESEEVSE